MKEMNSRPLRLRLGALAAAVAAVFVLGQGVQAQDAVGRAAVAAVEQRLLIPGGKAVGIAVETEGLVLVGNSDLGTTASPARLAGLKPGDIITKVNGREVRSAEELAGLLTAGQIADLTVIRNGSERSFEIVPAADPRDGTARIGAWVRSSTAGIGTLSFIDPVSGRYGALGHAISDVDTGVLLPIAEGSIYESEILRVKRGERGAPGELMGDFLADGRQIGSVEENNESGIYGLYTGAKLDGLLFPEGLPAAVRDEVRTGDAQIITTVGDAPQLYDVEIESVDSGRSGDLRAIVVRVTDPDLLEITGGIVQGMSGSPIIQDGKLVGAVTHVFVNDPTRGYGIFIENMLEAAE